MTFPPAVKTEALAACGRHCCVCHKFCGIKIECHHIEHAKDGGPDTPETCIPLCFDCHADMQSYDTAHPKGTKYSPGELRRHRDGWYAKVAAGGAFAPPTSDLEVDRQVFAAFQRLVPYFPTFDYLKGRNFAGFAFPTEPLDPLGRYCHYAGRVEYEFLDPELEGARGAFASATCKFVHLLATNTWPTHLGGAASVPPEWEEVQPDRFHTVVSDLHQAADAVEETYAALIRLARRRLGVAGAIEPPAGDA